MRKALLLVFFVTVLASSAFAQDRCGTVEYVKSLRTSNQLRETKDGFEKWMLQKQQQRLLNQSARTQAALQIPVVVHVIHNGENIGTGTNIPDAQILSQLSVLNKDYSRQNADAANTPAEFLGVAGAFDVEFVLAKQDPEGLATSGIVRVKGSKSSWTMNDNYQLKALSYWPAEDYLNIWVCRLTDFLGYAQFPVSALPGLENSSTNRLTDGVVIAYNAFGSADDGSFILQNAYNKGRTATHEIGHFFGLNHIWGDDDNACTGSDYVDDTPNQAGSSSGCPVHPRVTCTVTSMFQNYLDYTNDVCMNLFTQGQVDRMEVVIANSPRRGSLTVSHGLNDPAPVANDLGVKEIVRPAGGECPAGFTPEAEVRNYGSNVINSARIRLRRDGVITETKDFTFSPALGLLESRSVQFAHLTFSSGTHNVSFEIQLVNGVADGQNANNNLSQAFDVPEEIALPFLETFAALPPQWSIVNPDQEFTWELSSTLTPGNNAMKMAFYDYEDHVGEIDALISPAFDLSSAPAALLKFDVAYAQYSASDDGLKVILLNNCNTQLGSGTVIYNKSGSSLATTSNNSSSFVPAAGDWRSETIDLSPYIGQHNLQLAFVGQNDWGNNLYLDNIGLTTSPIADVVATGLIQPSPVTCESSSHPVVRVFNAGTLVTSLTVTVTVNGLSAQQTLEGLNIPGNTSADLTLNPVTLAEGENTLHVVLSAPNGDPDFFPANNELDLTVIRDDTSDELPIRQRFDNNDIGPWTTTNPTGGMNWELIAINDNPAIYVNGFSNSVQGDQSWLVSPLLDFTDLSSASVRYDFSYASRANHPDRLYILASRDCGITFSDTIYTAGSGALARGRTSETSWRPSASTDWSANSVSLASLANATDVRIAFVFNHAQGNNLYLDNIEFYLTSSPLRIEEPMAVYPTAVVNEPLNVAFNLPEKSDVRLDIIDMSGRVLNSYLYEGVLNQSYAFNLFYNAGLYYVRATTKSRVYVGRFVIH